MEYSQEKRAGLNHVRFADEELIKTQVLQGEAAQTIIQGENCSVYKMENETGEGVITRYPVFPGIELLYCFMPTRTICPACIVRMVSDRR